MENTMENVASELNEWWDLCSLKADIDLDNVKVDIYEIMAMMECLKELDLLRANEVELEM